MRQLLQNLSSGGITVEEVPVPARSPAMLLVATRYSLISAGTERSALEIGRASLVGKARARPDLAQKVIESARTEGAATALAKIRGRLGEPNSLGYSLAGTVIESCEDAPASPGELVACAGAGYASHAEVVAVPRRLCARVPENVAAEDAAYATVASIALHGLRLANVGLGDVVAVVGLGLIGQLAAELAAAAGCVVLGLDPNQARCDLARKAGWFATEDYRDMSAEASRLTSGRGADAVLVTAASKGSEPLQSAVHAARERAHVVIIGDVAIESPRTPLFAKELKLVVSRSYGPGRYDPLYEERGIDYPASYVRWTEGRNLEEVLRLMSTGALRPARLTTHTFNLEDGAAAYELLNAGSASIGILLRYRDAERALARAVAMPRRIRPARRRRIRAGVVGAGMFARSVLMPQLAAVADIAAVCTSTGVSARASAERFGAALATTAAEEVLLHPDLDAVVIATRHDMHARYAALALQAGKHVFVEKPLALDLAGLEAVERASAESAGVLMVGFNRRFAPLARRMQDALGGRGPLMITIRVNAGRLPRSHWVHDPIVGGGRVVGELCHFVDLAMFFTGSTPSGVQAAAVSGSSEPRDDTLAATITFADGSVACVIYCALGDPRLPKERVEVFGELGAGVLDDFRSLNLYLPSGQRQTSGKRDKGHAEEIRRFVGACREGIQPWPVQDIVQAMRTTLAVRDAILLPPGP